MKSKNYEVLTLAVLVVVGASQSFACGPTFPNSFLERGDSALFNAPVAHFARELERMQLPPPLFPAVPATNSRTSQTIEADISDLRAALKQQGLPDAAIEDITRQHQAERDKLESFRGQMSHWRYIQKWAGQSGEQNPQPQLGEIKITEGLPAEFADCFRAAIAFYQGDTNTARTLWSAVLNRPPAERPFRSVWAAYMLGRTATPSGSDEALSYYKMVCDLAKQGFYDSTGLASAAVGWEAKTQLDRHNFARAFELYLGQKAAGDPSAMDSLRITAREALSAGPDTLKSLAADARSRNLITAFILARDPLDPVLSRGKNDAITAWLEAVESADVTDVASAERFALVAYQNDYLDQAQRWIFRAPTTPLSQWLQAKIYLHDGKVNEAAALLSEVVPLFRTASTNNSNPRTAEFYVELDEYFPCVSSMANRALGELGALQLARRDYEQSLDALLRSSYWMDAAYVAERVMTVEELQAYVDRDWPATSSESPATKKAEGQETSSAIPSYDEKPVSSPREEIRYLLARRLTRLDRGGEARPYFPAEYQKRLDAMLNAIAVGRDTTNPGKQRADSLFEASRITRHDGMELMGTELAPDWHVVAGNNQLGLTSGMRIAGDKNHILTASEDELRRYNANTTEPDDRFRYRTVAESIGMEATRVSWDAAKEMPGNSDETAMVLFTAGSWLKNSDPKAADVFYKALVRRCRKTALGAEADRLRWFPIVDKDGNIVKKSPKIPKQGDPG